MKKNVHLLIIFLFFFASVNAQKQISVRAFPIGIHPFENKNLSLYKNKISSNGMLDIEPGVILGFETYPKDNRVAYAISQGVFTDCAGKPAGYTQLAVKGYIVDKKSLQQIFGIAIGPALFYRNSWTDIPGYVDVKYNKTGNIEYKAFIISVQIQYNIRLSKRSDLTLSLNHVEPQAISFSVGYSFYTKRPANPCDCPSFKTH